MITHAEEVIEESDLKIFKSIKEKLSKIDKFPIKTELLTCHMLAHAVAEVYDLKVVDGFWRSGYNHSWIETDYLNVIDVYPVGMVGGPVLLDHIVTGGQFYYTPDNFELIGDVSSTEFRESVEIIKKCLT